MIQLEKVPTQWKVRTFINDMQTEVHIIDSEGNIRFRGGFDVMPTHFAWALERLADIEPLLPKWVSVNDRNPPMRGDYHAVVDGLEAMDYWDGRSWDMAGDITHWLDFQLPPLPSEAQK